MNNNDDGSGKKVARPARFERTTVRLEGGCSIQLSYGRSRLTVASPAPPRKRPSLLVSAPAILLELDY